MVRGKTLCMWLAGVVTLAFSAGGAFAQTCVPLTGQKLIIWHAGSLSTSFTALETAFTCQTGIAVSDNSAGSMDMLRQVTAGNVPCDIVAPADYLDIDLFLEPEGYANWDIRFAQDQMVLAYCLGSGATCGGASKLNTSLIGSGAFAPTGPADSTNIPTVAANWYQQIVGAGTPPAAPAVKGVTFGGSHLFLDPSGYKAPQIFNLAQQYYNVPNLYDLLLEHYLATPAASGSPSFKIGLNYDLALTYMHNAYASAKADSNYQYVSLPANINLGSPAFNSFYSQAVIVEPDLDGTDFVKLPASSTTWGITVLNNAPNPTAAVQFIQLLLGSTGQAEFNSVGPVPITPAVVSCGDAPYLPSALQSLVGPCTND